MRSRRGVAALCLMAALMMAGTARAGCYADYKAKQDAPLRLHYGVAALPDQLCQPGGDPTPELRARLRAAGWTLLQVISVFGPEGLAERKANAGAWFLRF